MKLHTLALLAALVFAPAAAAQCSTLTSTGSATSLKLTVSGGTATSLTFLALSMKAGTTEIKFGAAGTLTLGLEQRIFVMPLGITDKNGDLSRTFRLHRRVKAFDLKGQAVNMSFDRMTQKLSFCTSNVADIKGGS